MGKDNKPSGRKSPSFIEQARRAQIAEAASEVVAERGYAGTSVSAIAEKAGISKGVVTYHFASKDEILRMVATQFFERAWQHMETQIAAEPSAAGQVRAWIRSQLEYFGAHRTDFLAMSDIMANHRGDDGAPAFADELAEEVEGLAEILRQGQRDGELREFDVVGVANIILRCADGVLVTWASNPSPDLTAQIPVLLDFIDHAIDKD